MNNIKFIEYNIYSINTIKLNHMVKITLKNDTNLESFWVWVESINNDSITGIISNILQSTKLEIGQLITFDSKNIKDISNRSYTKDETNISILITKTNNNPITKYFQSINVRFC
jgi:uncharacterized protein YegJ (DUF2314 family)